MEMILHKLATCFISLCTCRMDVFNGCLMQRETH